MESILVMALAGSTMTILCKLARRRLRDRACAHLHYLLARAAVLYYLVPLRFLKGCYEKAVRAVVPEGQMEIAQIALTRTSYAVHADGKTYANVYAGIQTAAAVIWLIVAGFLMAKQLLAYLRTARMIARYTSGRMTDSQERFIRDIKAQYRVRRRVLLYQGRTGEPAMTFGVCRPVIICSREAGTREAELLVRHEMVHIRRMDAFWKMLIQFVMFLHWWNPIMWKLYRDFDCVCELSCDEAVMRGKSEGEVKEYLRLLIEEARQEGQTAQTTIRWKARFGENKREIRERMDNLMKKKKWNRFAAGMLAATLIFANSFTVFAYRDTVHEYVAEETSQEEIESVLEDDTVLFFPEEADWEEKQELELLEIEEIHYDHQFTDEEGNVYQVPDEAPASTYRSCDHTFVSGTEQRHKKNSDGSCLVRVYKAQRCSKCGTLVQGDLISTTTYTVCPH